MPSHGPPPFQESRERSIGKQQESGCGLSASNHGLSTVDSGRQARHATDDKTHDPLAPPVRPVGGNIARAAEVEALFAEARRLCGKIDILVNNAGSTPSLPSTR